MLKALFPFLFLMSSFMLFSFHSSFAEELECEHPVLDALSKKLPVFDIPETKRTLYRGVKDPQFNWNSILKFMFHDPWTFSNGTFIERGDKGSASTSAINNGSWVYQSDKAVSDLTNQYLKRLDEALYRSNLLLSEKEWKGRQVWKLLPIDNASGTVSGQGDYDSAYYNWVQFASPSEATSKRYSSDPYFVFELTPGPKRAHPGSSFESVLPLLVAPWEVNLVRHYDSGLFEIRKKFSTGNRCQVDYLELYDNNNSKPFGYLYLCEREFCERDESVIISLEAGFKYSLKLVKTEGFSIGYTKNIPDANSQCRLVGKWKGKSDFENNLKQMDRLTRIDKMRTYIRLLNTQKKSKCYSEIERIFGYWKEIEIQDWFEALVLAEYTQAPAHYVNALKSLLELNLDEETMVRKLSAFASTETNRTREDFFKHILHEIEKDENLKKEIKTLNLDKLLNTTF